MRVVNDIAKTWLKIEAEMLEKYKYANEGTRRTAGSYILTCIKSMLKLADEDPEMFKVAATVKLAPIAATAVVASAVPVVYYKLKERKNSKLDVKEND